MFGELKWLRTKKWLGKQVAPDPVSGTNSSLLFIEQEDKRALHSRPILALEETQNQWREYGNDSDGTRFFCDTGAPMNPRKTLELCPLSTKMAPPSRSDVLSLTNPA